MSPYAQRQEFDEFTISQQTTPIVRPTAAIDTEPSKELIERLTQKGFQIIAPPNGLQATHSYNNV